MDARSLETSDGLPHEPVSRDGSGNPFPVRNTGTCAPVLSMTDALSQRPNTGFVRLMETTGAAPSAAGLRSTQVVVEHRSPAGTVVGQHPRGATLPEQTVTLSVSRGRVPAPPAPPGTRGPTSPSASPLASAAAGR